MRPAARRAQGRGPAPDARDEHALVRVVGHGQRQHAGRLREGLEARAQGRPLSAGRHAGQAALVAVRAQHPGHGRERDPRLLPGRRAGRPGRRQRLQLRRASRRCCGASPARCSRPPTRRSRRSRRSRSGSPRPARPPTAATRPAGSGRSRRWRRPRCPSSPASSGTTSRTPTATSACRASLVIAAFRSLLLESCR